MSMGLQGILRTKDRQMSEKAAHSNQNQLDSLKSTVALLLDKFDQFTYRSQKWDDIVTRV